MRTNPYKNSFLVRSLLVVMSVMYVASPLHSEFNLLLHNLSHQITSEANHYDEHHAEKFSEKEKHHHNESHHHESLTSKHDKQTKHHHKKATTETHTHEILSVFYAFFNTDTSQNNSAKDFIENKVDKHILSFKAELPCSIQHYEKKNLWYYYSIIQSLKIEVIIPPPQTTHA